LKDTKALLTSFVEVVTFLLTAFGGFLKKIAPPDQTGASYAVGAMSFLMLIVLMIASAVGRNKVEKRPSRGWVIAGVVLFFFALTAAFVYPYVLSRYTYPQFADPKTRRINASVEYLSPDARRYLSANPNATPEELDRNLPDGDIWTHAGIQRAELWLLAAYACLVLSISGAIFSLLEANLSGTTKSNAVSG
jgi:hypothetical protein